MKTFYIDNSLNGANLGEINASGVNLHLLIKALPERSQVWICEQRKDDKGQLETIQNDKVACKDFLGHVWVITGFEELLNQNNSK